MSRHAKLICDAKIFCELNVQGQTLRSKTESPFLSTDCKLRLMPMLLHAADVSNPIKPLAVYMQHANKVMEEFFQQGDIERFSNLEVSPLCDRGSTSIAQSQVCIVLCLCKLRRRSCVSCL